MAVPDFEGFTLAQIETSSIEFTSLIFYADSKNSSKSSTLFVHLYHPEIISADFVCAPYFESTRAVRLSKDETANKILIEITLGNGQLHWACSEISFYTKSENAVWK